MWLQHTDEWTDKKHRGYELVYAVQGGHMLQLVLWGLRLDQSYIGKYIVKWVDHWIKMVRPTLFWSSLAVRTINVMLEDIEKLPEYKALIEVRDLSLSSFVHITEHVHWCTGSWTCEISCDLALQDSQHFLTFGVFLRNSNWLVWSCSGIEKSSDGWNLPKVEPWKQLFTQMFSDA